MTFSTKPIPAAILIAALACAFPAPAAAIPQQTDRETGSDADRDRQRDYYDQGTEALDAGDMREAERWFAKAAKIAGPRAAGAAYWQAYAQSRQGRRSEALETIKALRAAHPGSRWLDDARALEMEIGARSGKPHAPEKVQDENLKLYALQALQNADPNRAVPMLVEFLDGNHSPRLKEQALFVLLQSGAPAARAKVIAIARGRSNPDLQRKAIESLAIFDEGPEVRKALMEIYASSSDHDVRRAVLQGFMVSDDIEALRDVARTEKDPRLRREAIRALGVSDATEELMALYRAGGTAEDRAEIADALAIADAVDELIEIARNDASPELRIRAIRGLGIADSDRSGRALLEIYRSRADHATRKAAIEALSIQDDATALRDLVRTEDDPDLRQAAVRGLGIMDAEETGAMLLAIYRERTDRQTRKAVLDAFMIQDNAQALITVAREEKDPEMRRIAVERLSHVDSEEATEFMIGILKEDR